MNRLLYVISLSQEGYYNAHSLIREKFNAPENKCVSFLMGDTLIVKSEQSPKNLKDVSVHEVKDVVKDGDVIGIRAMVCFDNRHTGKKFREQGRKSTNNKILANEAREKFAEAAGISTDSAISVSFAGVSEQRKFNINNVFYIHGKVKVINKEKFLDALINGIGSRKSYGFGLILTTKENV